jgi:hypothetical protein
MKYLISVEDAGYVHVVVCDLVNLRRAIQIVMAAINEAAIHGLLKILLDICDAHIVLSPQDTYELFDYAADLGLDQDLRIAIAYCHEPREYQHIENVAANRGYVLRVFKDIDQARSWLTAPDVPEQQSPFESVPAPPRPAPRGRCLSFEGQA